MMGVESPTPMDCPIVSPIALRGSPDPLAQPLLQAVRDDMALPPGTRVAVAMSGGVDSSTVAGLLVQAGYEVFGLTARLYDVDPRHVPTSGTCCAPDDARDARAVAQALGIRHYVLDERESFARTVVDRFVQQWDQGLTPNPCVECNRSLKFGRLVEVARALGAQALATGHYARLDLHQGQPRLRRGLDAAKDQAYFLYPLAGFAARFLRFPLGCLDKTEVRAHAAQMRLPTASKRESMDICFVGAQTAKEFVQERVGARPGVIVDAQGVKLAQHQGIAGFTVGQRHGLGLPGQGPQAPVRYVIDKRPDGTVIVGEKQQLLVDTVTLQTCTWLVGPPTVGQTVLLQVRHRGQAVPALVQSIDSTQITLQLLGELSAAARGQSGVLFQAPAWVDSPLLGGGLITSASNRPARADARRQELEISVSFT